MSPSLATGDGFAWAVATVRHPSKVKRTRNSRAVVAVTYLTVKHE